MTLPKKNKTVSLSCMKFLFYALTGPNIPVEPLDGEPRNQCCCVSGPMLLRRGLLSGARKFFEPKGSAVEGSVYDTVKTLMLGPVSSASTYHSRIESAFFISLFCSEQFSGSSEQKNPVFEKKPQVYLRNIPGESKPKTKTWAFAPFTFPTVSWSLAHP